MLGNRVIIFLSLSVVCVLVCVFLSVRTTNSQQEVYSLTEKISSIISRANQEANQIIREPSGVEWSLLRTPFFLVDSTTVLAWSTNRFFPDLQWNSDSAEFQLSIGNSGEYLVKSWPMKGDSALIAVIPLVRRYPISNRYLLPEWNDEIFDGIRGVILSDSDEGLPINLKGKEIFRIKPVSAGASIGFPSFLFATLAIMLFLIAIFYDVRTRYKSERYEFGFIVLMGALTFIRVMMLTYDYPSAWLTSAVFDPQYFASSNYNSSIGDLFLNSLVVLILCGYIFYTYPHWKAVRYILTLSGWFRYAAGCFLITLAFFSFLYPFLFVETIFHNSTISLDITEALEFDWLRSLAWLSVLAGSISAFFFVHVFINLSKSILIRKIHFLTALATAGLLFTAYFLGAARNYELTLIIGFIFFLILYFTRITTTLRHLRPITFIYFFVFIGGLGIQHGLSIKHFMEEKRAESQFKFASNYLIGRDVLGEYLLNESIKRIRGDAFIQGRLTNPFLAKSPIRQKIMRVYLNSYFDRYESRIYLYNAAGEPLDNSSSTPLSSFRDHMQNKTNNTEYDGIFFIQPSDIDSNKRYLALVPIHRAEVLAGYVLIDLSLKRVIPQNVYPELLVDRRFAEFFENRDRSFSFIKEGKILSSFGSFNYERDFDYSHLNDPDFYKRGIIKKGLFHTGIEDSSGQVAVITSAAYPFFYVLTNFSFFFVLGVVLLVMAILVYGLISLVRGYKVNYAARIQLYIYLAFSLPLFVATITTLNRVSNSAERELNENFEANARNLRDGILPSVTDFFNGVLSRDDFENILIDKAKVANVDITFYDRSGKYVASSQPLMVESQIMSPLMDRAVWEKINGEGVATFINDERIGGLQFNNCYVTIKSPDSGMILGTLSVPFFDSANSREATQVNVLSNFLTVFAIIFILFSILSFYVVDTLTFPLRFITRILSRTTLSGNNEPLEWKSNDEIGMMVSEYNKMVHNLEQSKIELARSQKESAWREIAKQVAHEIKNPLTPMKLTLQQMEHQLLMHKLDDEKARTSIRTLLTQVDILNEIASSFSAFARMPAPILAKLDLVTLLKKSIDLYANYEGGSVVFQSAVRSAIVMGDEQLFNRIFSNIILNGLQSGESEKITVKVDVIRDQGSYLVTVADNGRGIKQEMINKVFIPYFSTKQSGSGLGLAISKQGIEQSGGEIWFDSTPGEGTIFYIRFPVGR